MHISASKRDLPTPISPLIVRARAPTCLSSKTVSSSAHINCISESRPTRGKGFVSSSNPERGSANGACIVSPRPHQGRPQGSRHGLTKTADPSQGDRKGPHPTPLHPRPYNDYELRFLSSAIAISGFVFCFAKRGMIS